MLCFESFLGVTEVRKCIWSSKGCSLVLRSVRCVLRGLGTVQQAHDTKHNCVERGEWIGHFKTGNLGLSLHYKWSSLSVSK